MSIRNTASINIPYSWKAVSSVDEPMMNNSPLRELHSELDFVLRTRFVDKLSGLLRNTLDESFDSSYSSQPLEDINICNSSVKVNQQFDPIKSVNCDSIRAHDNPLWQVKQQHEQYSRTQLVDVETEKQQQHTRILKRGWTEEFANHTPLVMESLQEERQDPPMKKRRRYSRRNSVTKYSFTTQESNPFDFEQRSGFR